jgi:hypothetical protein
MKFKLIFDKLVINFLPDSNLQEIFASGWFEATKGQSSLPIADSVHRFDLYFPA